MAAAIAGGGAASTAARTSFAVDSRLSIARRIGEDMPIAREYPWNAAMSTLFE
jgi:hypothetical protein